MSIFSVLRCFLFLLLLSPQAILIAQTSSTIIPTIIEARADPNDPWFPYKSRPTKDQAEQAALYPREILDKIPDMTMMGSSLVPWSFKGTPTGPKELVALSDIVVDKITDPGTGKTYRLMYHGTTSDLLPIFKEGAKAIRFDAATHVALGMGFYLTSSLNEAKAYACERLRERKRLQPNLQAIILVVGVEDKPEVKGKMSKTIHLSDNKTGAPLDQEIFFKRNHILYNQFSFFNNVSLEILSIVILPPGFGRAHNIQDNDGEIQDSPKVKDNPSLFICDA